MLVMCTMLHEYSVTHLYFAAIRKVLSLVVLAAR
jgi:hypothetical protein